jgi:surface antigen
MKLRAIMKSSAGLMAATSLVLGAVPALAIGDPANAPQTADAATSTAVEQAGPSSYGGGRGFLGNVFGCEASGSKQVIGAVIGAAAGGLIGNRIAGSNNRALGTILGGTLGGMTGSWLGCKLQRNAQVKAQRAVEQAAVSGKNQTWSDAESGASGDVKVSKGISATDLAGLKLANGVEPAAAYTSTTGPYVATAAVNVRSAPATTGKIIGKLASGDEIWVPAGVKGSPWLLVSQNGVGQGYVSSALLKPATKAVASKCRTIEHTINTEGAAPATEKLQACPGADGQWTMTRA